MSTGRDDDAALSWGGDDDPTLDTGTPAPEPEPVATTSLPDGYTPLGKGSQAYAAPDESETSADVAAPASTPEKAPLGNVELVAFGVLGGIYLLFTVGWIIGGLRLQDVAVFLVSPAAYVPAFVLAALAPAIWFVTTYLLTRRSHAWLRFTWLIVGVVLLVPWPFIMVGALGQ